jgi:2-keto-3-deoxy-L-rhamnonate aldolase RhmA
MEMTSFAGRLRAGDRARAGLRGLWLTFLTPFGLEVAAASGAEWVGIDVQPGVLARQAFLMAVRGHPE